MLGAEVVISDAAMREQTAAYLKAVIEAYPELAALMPDTDGPPRFDPYPTPTTFARITRSVAMKYGIDHRQIRGASREQRVSLARHECFYLARMTGRYSYPQIGDYYGKRDHSTVIHGVRAHARRNKLALPDDMRWRSS